MLFPCKPLGVMISLIVKYVVFCAISVTEIFTFVQYYMNILCK